MQCSTYVREIVRLPADSATGHGPSCIPLSIRGLQVIGVILVADVPRAERECQALH